MLFSSFSILFHLKGNHHTQPTLNDWGVSPPIGWTNYINYLNSHHSHQNKSTVMGVISSEHTDYSSWSVKFPLQLWKTWPPHLSSICFTVQVQYTGMAVSEFLFPQRKQFYHLEYSTPCSLFCLLSNRLHTCPKLFRPTAALHHAL